MIRVWVAKLETGAFDEDAQAADLLQDYEAKIAALERKHDLQPKRRRRYGVTTDSDHDNPIFPDRTRDVVLDWPNQIWIADVTYITVAAGFVYLADP